MNINKNSWHYKLVKNTFNNSGRIPTSLCPYFWSVVFRVVVYGAMAFLAVFLASNMLFEPMVSLGLSTVWAYIASFFASILMSATAVGVGIGVVLGIAWVYDHISEWNSDRKYENAKKEIEDRKNGVQPSILSAFIKAKHRKICPMLNFVDKE